MPYKPGDITKGVASRVARGSLDLVDKGADWWELPLPAQLAQLAHFREDLRRFNLYDTEEAEGDGEIAVLSEPPPYRTYDGSQTDPDHPRMGQTGMRFGRNMPIDSTYPHEQGFFDPSPREVSRALLNRDTFKPATSLNVLAACWLQFQNHDWFSHGDNSETEFIQVPLSPDDDWDGGTMEVRRTSPDSTNAGGNLPPTYVNKVTPWWDGSQLYGSTEERNRELRAGEDGKLALDGDLLPNETNADLTASTLTGFSDNWWVGLEVYAHAVRPRAQRDLRHAQGALTRAGTTSSCS